MKTASYRVVRMSVCYQDVEEEVMYGIEAICPEEGKVLDRVCRISENEAEVQKLSEMMNQNELSLRHFRCVVDDFRHLAGFCVAFRAGSLCSHTGASIGLSHHGGQVFQPASRISWCYCASTDWIFTLPGGRGAAQAPMLPLRPLQSLRIPGALPPPAFPRSEPLLAFNRYSCFLCRILLCGTGKHFITCTAA